MVGVTKIPGLEFRAEKGLAEISLKEPHWSWDADPPSPAIVGYVMSPNGILVPVTCARLFLRSVLSPHSVAFRAYGVGGVFTVPAWRKKGIAGLLLAEVDRWAREHGATMLALYAVPARPLYVRAGFVEVLKASERESLWLKSTDPAIEPRPGAWRVWPTGHF